MRSIFKLKRADHATQPIAQSAALASAAVPLTNYPEEKNRRKKNQQIDRDQRREANSDHGVAGCWVGGGAVMISLPHSTAAIPQTNPPAMAAG